MNFNQESNTSHDLAIVKLLQNAPYLFNKLTADLDAKKLLIIISDGRINKKLAKKSVNNVYSNGIIPILIIIDKLKQDTQTKSIYDLQQVENISMKILK